MVYLVFGFIAIVMVMWFLQFRTTAICCGDWDGYYHIRWSSLLWENFSQGKWLPTFEWLPLTVLNPQDYNDHHFLFHLLQIPFLWFFEPVMAAKVAAVVFSSLAIFSVYWLLYRYDVDHLLDLVRRDPDLRQHVLLPDEHGEGTAADDHHHGRRDLSAFRAEIRVAAAADVRVRVDVQPVPAAVDRGAHLDRRSSRGTNAGSNGSRSRTRLPE